MKLIKDGKPFTGSLFSHENDKWKFFDTYVDGRLITFYDGSPAYAMQRKWKPNEAWWLFEFDHIIRVVLSIQAHDENLKQLRSKYEGDYHGIYRVASLCSSEPDQNLAINAHLLRPKIRVFFLKAFLAHMREHQITGQRFQILLDEFADHYDLSKLDVSKEDDSFLDPIINNVVNEHSVKIKSSEPSKIVNFLVGQVMKQCKGQKVDMVSLKTKIESAVTKS